MSTEIAEGSATEIKRENDSPSLQETEDKIERAENINTTNLDNVKKEEEDSQTHVERDASCSINIDELEILFANRYTENNPSYMKISEGFDPVIIIHPWASGPKRVYDYSRRNRGGWRGGRGYRGNNWRGGRDDNRRQGGYGDRKRHMDDNGSGYRGNSRVHYPGREHH